MRTINILGAFIVLVANLWVSFTHSINLFHLGGFNGRLALVGVIGAEVTFLMGALNMVVSKLKGENAGGPAKAGFLLGVSLILWSNIRAGLSAGLTGVILGAVTPVSLIISEAILSRAILHKAEPAAQVIAEPAGVPESPKVEYEPPKVEYTPPEAPAKLTVVKLTRPAEPPKVDEPPAQQDELGEVGEMALELFKESGRLPTRRELAAKANTTEWRARLVIEELKQRQYLQNSLA